MPRTVHFEHCFVFAMAAETLANLTAVFEKADTPQELRHYLQDTLELARISDLVGYVERETYEREWKELIVGAFPIVQAREAVEARAATEDQRGHEASPAVPGFTAQQQRLLISRMRSTYKVAMGVEREEEETQKTAKEDAYQADMEKPLDPETRRRLKKQWDDLHDWQPLASMKSGPKLRNRVVREFLGDVSQITLLKSV